MNQELVEIREHEGAGYQPLVYFGGWRVALLNDDPTRYRRETMPYLERHNETDETFVLLSGGCTLDIGSERGDAPGTIEALPLELKKIYNVKKGVWHNLTGTPDMTLLIVENADTTKQNSEYYRALTQEMLSNAIRSTGIAFE